MRLRTLNSLLLGFALPAVCLAQDWDAVAQAKSWARQDVTGAFVFRDGNLLRTWTRDASLSGSVDVSKVESTPEFWVIDTWDRAWVVAGTTLTAIDKNGKVVKKDTLPATVADLAWDGDAFYLSYRTETYYVEKRSFKSGDTVWASGAKPRKGDAPAPRFYRIAPVAGGLLAVSMGAEMNFTILQAATGKATGQTALALANAPVPPLQALSPDRLPILWWEAGAQLLAALPASQLAPALKGSLTGLILARIDLAKGTIVLLPTGLEEGAQLVGALDAEVTLVKPGGGLVFLQLK